MFFLCPFFSASAFGEGANDLTLKEQNILVVVGYVGLADFCWAYGVDYREIAHKVKKSIIADAQEEGVGTERLVYVGFEAAARGNIYSPSVGDMINLSDSTNTKQACKNMYVQFQKIARMK